MRVGFGYDSHRLVTGRPCIIGGVEVPSDVGLLGHSDADVLLHAIGDALLGAAALGDLGTHFPDSDDRWRNADSRALLSEIVRLLHESKYRVVNVDATVVIERPKLKPHIQHMREIIAQLVAVRAEDVSVKATTNEGMGEIGRGEGAAAYAVCTIVRVDESA